MRFACSIASACDAEAAVEELLLPIDDRITPGMVDLVLLFTTGHFTDEVENVVDRVYADFPNAIVLGCTAEGTIGHDQELQSVPSMSLLASSLPDVRIRPFHVCQEQIESAKTVADWERIVGVSPENKPTFIALADPFRADIHGFVERINEAYPETPLVGGVASSAQLAGENRLIVGDRIHRKGIVGVALTGRCAVDTVVSQGCRPIGSPLVVTRGERNLIHELGGHPALEQLHRMFTGLSAEDKLLARQSLFLGRAIDEYKDRFHRGDFLIESIIGVERATGAIGIAGAARVGATVQFHVRDAISADQDLRAMLASHAASDVRGAMLFGCNGRGIHMWPRPGHDVGVLREVLGDVPVAGVFCGGEFGPVGGRNFVHGFTASIALFREPDAP